MATIVFDIETIGCDFDSLDGISQEYFLKFAETEEEKEQAKGKLGLCPLTAQIAAIGILEVETEKSFVYFQNGGKEERFTDGNTSYIAAKEKDILQFFWNHMRTSSQFITFNGRCFDCPFVMIRSAVNRIKPARNLMPYRFDYKSHIDLADQLSFYDALRPKFGLHMWCQAFGIESPKEEGVSGSEVGNLFKAERYKDIAKYCMADVKATKTLYGYWNDFLKF